jgi:hypothetical protein
MWKEHLGRFLAHLDRRVAMQPVEFLDRRLAGQLEPLEFCRDVGGVDDAPGRTHRVPLIEDERASDDDARPDRDARETLQSGGFLQAPSPSPERDMVGTGPGLHIVPRHADPGRTKHLGPGAGIGRLGNDLIGLWPVP